MTIKGNMHMDIRVMRVADIKSEVRFVLRGCLEATMVSEAIEIAEGGNINMNIRGFKVADFKSDVRVLECLKASIASQATNMFVSFVSENSEISLKKIVLLWPVFNALVTRWSIGPLPSCHSCG